MQTLIAVKYAYKCHLGEVMPLGNHLRTDKYLRFALAERFQNLDVPFLVFCRVGVHAQHLDIGKHTAK